MTADVKRILILDDDSFHNTICVISLKKLFSELQADIVGFTDPAECLQYIENNYVSNPVKTIFFLDINMPSLSGWQVLEHLECMPSLVISYFTIYILSSSIDHNDMARAKENKLVKAYLTKPLSTHLKSGLFLSRINNLSQPGSSRIDI